MKSCVCYVIDDNYLFPTLVSAKQARVQTSPELADVLIICIADESERTRIAATVAAEFGVILTVVPRSVIENKHPMFGRLFIDTLLPEGYDRIVYLDGDTQIMGSLDPLLTVDIKPGTFLAVRDPSGMFARLSKTWMSRILQDREKAGITRNYDDYFNTGVLVFNRKDWPELARQTLETIEGNPLFKYGDQDPMNLAVGDKCVYLSNKWNFPGFLIGSQVEDEIKPAVYHFMSNPRPWTHPVMPWGVSWQRPYDQLLKSHSELTSMAPQASLVEKLRYHVQQFIKVVTEYSAVGKIKESGADLKI